MLVLTRKVGDCINIGDDIVVKVIEISRNNVRIGIEAPRNVSVLRNEVYEKIQKENILSAQSKANDLVKAARLWEQKRSKE